MEDAAAQYPEEMLQLMRKFPGAEPADILQLIAVSICMPLCFMQPISSTEKKIVWRVNLMAYRSFSLRLNSCKLAEYYWGYHYY
jgi:hypothetical protein